MAYNVDSTNLQWNFNTSTGVLTISGVGRMRDYDMDTKAPWWYHLRNQIHRIVIEDGVTTVGTYAMWDLIVADSVQFGNTLQIIREYGFQGCNSLQRVYFPASLQRVEYQAFTYNNSLTVVDFGDAASIIDGYAFAWNHAIHTLRCTNVTEIQYRAFDDDDHLANLDLGVGLVRLGDHAFNRCSALRKIFIPASVTQIESGVFAFTTTLDTIQVATENTYFHSPVNSNTIIHTSNNSLVAGCRTSIIPDGTTQIEGYSFEGCIGLPSAVIPGSVTSIGHQAFYYCTGLQTVTFNTGLLYIYGYAFCNCTSLQTINFPSSLISLGDNSFRDCRGLQTVTFNAGLQYVYGYAFCNCTSLQTINFPSSLISLGDNSFRDCTGLQTVTLNDGLQRIESCVFFNCQSLQSIVLPGTLQSIDSEAFGSCTALSSANFPNSITSVGCRVFNNCTSLHTPIYNNRFFVFLPIHYKGAYSMPNTIQVMCCGSVSNCDSVTAITLSDRLQYVPDAAFENCQRLVSVTMKDSVSSIGSSAFSNCIALASVVIPDAVTNIGSSAFNNCNSLTSITIPASLQNLGEYVFNACSSLKHVIWNAKDAHLSWYFYYYSEADILNNMSWCHPFYNIRQQIQTFTLGDSVRVVPRYLCYEMDHLTSISIGYKVDSIEKHVFDGCTRLSSIHWNAKTMRDPQIYLSSPFYILKSNISTFTFGDSVLHIPAYLCHGMNHLSRLYIPENVESIGDYAFRDLNALDSIYVHPNNIHFDSRNNCNALIDSDYDRLLLGCYKTQIPDDIHSIGACAFRRVRRLTSAIIPESVTNIEEEAFNGCADLDTVALPSTLTAINDYTFQDCSALDTIALPPTLQFIGIRAFSNCSALPEITLPDVIDYIDQYAFSNCSGFEQILSLATTPPTIKKTTFLGTSCPIYVPCPYLASYRSAPVWEDYGTRVFGTFDYKLTVRPNDYFWGSDSIYQLPTCEANAIIYAEPHSGYEFVEWQDSLGHTLSTEQLYEFYVDEDITVIAVFREKQQALDAIDARTAVWVNERKVMLLSDQDVNARLYDLTGRQVDACAAAANVTASLQAPASGVYVVVTDGRQQKVIVQ